MFQQELLSLLDSFEIYSLSNYHRLPPGDKTYFLRRLYKVFANSERTVVEDLARSEGLKLHFASSGDLSANDANVPTEAFFKKTAFYASKTLVTFPFKRVTDRKQLRELQGKDSRRWQPRWHDPGSIYFGEISSERTGYGGEIRATGTTYIVDSAALMDLINTAIRLKPAIAAGVSVLIPLFPGSSTLRNVNRKAGVISANFRLQDLLFQFNESVQPEDGIVVNKQRTRLLIPHFSGIPLERVIEIRQKEEKLYLELQARLSMLMYGASQIESETKLLNYMRDVDEGVRDLHRKFQEIEEAYRRKDIFLTIKFLAAILVMMAPIDAAAAISTVIGGGSALDYISTRGDRDREMNDLKSSKFYLPWLVFKSGGSEDTQSPRMAPASLPQSVGLPRPVG